MSQRAQRVRPGRAPGWNKTGSGHGAQNDRERTREGGGVGRADAEQHGAEKPGEGECHDHTEGGTDRAQPQTASQKPANDRTGRRAERHANADFMRALFDDV